MDGFAVMQNLASIREFIALYVIILLTMPGHMYLLLITALLGIAGDYDQLLPNQLPNQLLPILPFL
jgi:hypothetical protein